MAVAQKRNPPKKSTQGGGGGGLKRPQTAPGRPGGLVHAQTLPAGMGGGSDLATYSAGGLLSRSSLFSDLALVDCDATSTLCMFSSVQPCRLLVLTLTGLCAAEVQSVLPSRRPPQNAVLDFQNNPSRCQEPTA